MMVDGGTFFAFNRGSGRVVAGVWIRLDSVTSDHTLGNSEAEAPDAPDIL